jgi:hypothetical protein
MPEAATAQEKIPFILKLKYALYSALIFFLVANPQTYMVTRSIFKETAADGTPSPYAFFAHTGLFFLSVLALMMLPSAVYATH